MRPPTLSEVLTNQAPPPYTLTAFMAFLSQNHCLETLEFTLDASRYQAYYFSLPHIPPIPGSEEADCLKRSWDRLINAYIRPGSAREVNLASSERDFLLRIPNTYTPPSPEALDSAVYKITELMRESVLSPFLQSCQQKLAQSASLQRPLSFSLQMEHPSSTNQYARLMAQNQAAITDIHAQQTYGQGTMHSPASPITNMGHQLTSFTNDHQSGLTQLLHTSGARIVRPSSSRPTSVPSAEFLPGHDPWAHQNDDSDMSGTEDPITPPHTPPASSASMSPTTGAAQWRSKIKSQFSKMNSNRSKSRD